MQETMEHDGTFMRKFFMAKNDSDLKTTMKQEYAKAMENDIESIRQVVLDSEQPCPCGSGRKTKNCCIKRLQRKLLTQEHFAAT